MSRDASNLRDSSNVRNFKQGAYSNKNYFLSRVDTSKDNGLHRGNAQNIRHASNNRDISNMIKSGRDVSRPRDASNSTSG
jgi:hypothetical protein